MPGRVVLSGDRVVVPDTNRPVVGCGCDPCGGCPSCQVADGYLNYWLDNFEPLDLGDYEFGTVGTASGFLNNNGQLQIYGTVEGTGFASVGGGIANKDQFFQSGGSSRFFEFEIDLDYDTERFADVTHTLSAGVQLFLGDGPNPWQNAMGFVSWHGVSGVDEYSYAGFGIGFASPPALTVYRNQPSFTVGRIRGEMFSDDCYTASVRIYLNDELIHSQDDVVYGVPGPSGFNNWCGRFRLYMNCRQQAQFTLPLGTTVYTEGIFDNLLFDMNS